ncbi:DUF3000 domain-containing protein [Corynebacterium mayonis]|uniref:DUF3000 domain-containing protein n=1 Tax=Corynebacterium mayonis TaxID=3062461 RepID=UPI003140B669
MTNSDTSSRTPGLAAASGDFSEPGQQTSTPAEFTAAVESMHAAKLRPEITLGEIRPPQRPAPFSHAVGLEVDRNTSARVPVDSEGDAFGRLILLHSPESEEAWEGSMRLVAYIQADMDDAVASDPLLPDVAWQWLNESLAQAGAGFTNLGGTVTSTASVRFGEIGGPPRAYQLEMRASWTAQGIDLAHHVEAFATVLAHVAGLPPEDVSELHPR